MDSVPKPPPPTPSLAAPEPGVPKNSWYEHSFGELYPIIYAHRNEDAAREEICSLLRLLDVPRGRVLDLCCGAGRHTEALLREGREAIGLDLSPPLLACARERSILAGRLTRGDIRHLPFGSCFSCVFNLFSSFGYFLEDGENEGALGEMARVLVSGGVLVMDHMNRPWVEASLVPHSEERRAAGALIQDRRITGTRVEKDMTWIGVDGLSRRFTESVRIYGADELTQLFRRQGLAVMERWGSFAGDPLTPASARMILVARKEEVPSCDSR